MPHKRLTIGQEYRHLPAGTINYALDELDRLERLIGHAPGCPQALTSAESCSLVGMAKNTSSEAFWERGIAGITRGGLALPVIDEGATGGTFAKGNVAAMPTFEIDTPDATLHASKWCVPLAPIGPGRTGLVAVMGLICLRVNITDETHKFAALNDGDRQYLKSATSGFPIWGSALERETTKTGKQWCLVLVGGGGASGSSSGRRGARVITAISAATDNLSANWGSGGVHMLDPNTGEEIVPDPDPLVLVNPLQMSFGVDYWVAVEDGRIVDGSCGPWTWAALP
jgi:hypothetical protein